MSARCVVEVDAFHVVRPQRVGRERDGAVDRAEDFRVVVGLGVYSELSLIKIGVSFAGQCIGVVGVDLQRLFEQGARRLVLFLRLLRRPR